jgi:hypothetical protein
MAFFKCFHVFLQVFIRMLHMFHLSLDVSCKCFICIFLKQTGVAHVAIDPPATAPPATTWEANGGASGPHARYGGASDVWVVWAPHGRAETLTQGKGTLVLARTAGARRKWSVGANVRQDAVFEIWGREPRWSERQKMLFHWVGWAGSLMWQQGKPRWVLYWPAVPEAQ